MNLTLDRSDFPDPAASFDAPVEMLAACHDRMRDRCATLLRLRPHVAAKGADAASSAAARGVICYFDSAARDHHADEEQDLFPALLESVPGSDPVCIRELVEALMNEHRELQRLWEPVKAWLARVEAGEAPPSAPEIDAFVEGYERHTAREEQELFPMTERLLGPLELDAIGQSMRRRRGLAPS